MKSKRLKIVIVLVAWLPVVSIFGYRFWLNGFTPYGEARGKALEIEERIVDYVNSHKSWPKDLSFIQDRGLLYANGQKVKFDSEDLSVMFELDYLDPFSRLKKSLGCSWSVGTGRAVLVANPELDKFRSNH